MWKLTTFPKLSLPQCERQLLHLLHLALAPLASVPSSPRLSPFQRSSHGPELRPHVRFGLSKLMCSLLLGDTCSLFLRRSLPSPPHLLAFLLPLFPPVYSLLPLLPLLHSVMSPSPSSSAPLRSLSLLFFSLPPLPSPSPATQCPCLFSFLLCPSLSFLSTPLFPFLPYCSAYTLLLHPPLPPSPSSFTPSLSFLHFLLLPLPCLIASMPKIFSPRASCVMHEKNFPFLHFSSLFPFLFF